MYILSYGDWFEINQDKYDRIQGNIKGVTDETFTVANTVKDSIKEKINAYKLTDEFKNKKIKTVPKEKFFNEKLCDELKGELFDVQARQVTLYDDQFEVCDIFHVLEKEFIHTKINHGASSLSHLFNQGYVSASSFAKFKTDYVERVNDKITVEDNKISQDGTYVVRYLIINESSINRLPFFSKMTLDDKITTLKSQGFEVKLSWVNKVFK